MKIIYTINIGNYFFLQPNQGAITIYLNIKPYKTVIKATAIEALSLADGLTPASGGIAIPPNINIAPRKKPI